MKRIRYMIVAAAMAATAAQAAEIFWQPSINMYTDGSGDFVNTDGTLKLAISGSATRTSTNTINGVPFVNINLADINAGLTQNGVTLTSTITGEHDSAFKTGSFSDSDIGTVIQSALYGASTTTLTGLEIGEWYMIQVLANDARRNAAYVMGFSDGINDIATSTANNTVGRCQLSNDGEASGDSIIGYFQADNDTQTFDTAGSTTSGSTWNSGGRSQFNGLQLRKLDEAPVITPNPPSTPAGLYTTMSKMSVEVNWSASTGDGTIDYLVKRSSDSGSGYVTIGSTTDLTYMDTAVETNETYYYVVSSTNEYGASGDSSEATGVGFPYDIIGAVSANGPTLDFDQLYDNDVDTFYDYNSTAAYSGVDYGENNAKRIMGVQYVLRNWTRSVDLAPGCVFEGANSPDFSDAVVLFTVPSGVQANPSVNTGTITNTASFRYVRTTGYGTQPNYMMAELDFVTEDDVTENGTSTEWLDFYYDISGDNPSNFADYAEADVSDTDSDGLLAWEEYKLSGDPTDANSPVGVVNLYAWPEAPLENVIRWDVSPLADIDNGGGYVVYRSLVDSNYVAVATVTTNVYNDTDVTDGETYYYKASATNAAYAHETALSASEFAAANASTIFGVMNNSGAMVTRWFYELFDRNGDSFMDDNTTGGYGALDYGVGNGQAIEQVLFRLRNDSFGTSGSYQIEVNGELVDVNRAQYFVYGNTFEGSNDTNGNWTVLATITNMVPQHGEWNVLPVADATAYQYVRYAPANGLNNFAMADVEFLSADDFTAKGTPILWLEQYGLTEADDELDTDTDGHEAWQEFLAYTDPVDSNSVLRVNSFSLTNGMVITWQSVEGKSYGIYSTENLALGTPGLEATVTGLDGETSYTGTVSGASAVFYEVGVE